MVNRGEDKVVLAPGVNLEELADALPGQKGDGLEG